MNFTGLDWVIVAGIMALIVVMAIIINRYTKSVADYLAAGRATNTSNCVLSKLNVGIAKLTEEA